LHRNVGNLVPKDVELHTTKKDAHHNPNLPPKAPSTEMPVPIYSAGAAIEYALLNLGVTEFIVCGHSSCGAMKASLAGNVTDETPHLKLWLSFVEDSKKRLLQKNYSFKLMVNGKIEKVTAHIDPNLPDHDQLSQLNVLQQLENLVTYDLVANAKKLHLHGWWFDIKTADIYFFLPSMGKFVLIDAETAAELLKSFDNSDMESPHPTHHGHPVHPIQVASPKKVAKRLSAEKLELEYRNTYANERKVDIQKLLDSHRKRNPPDPHWLQDEKKLHGTTDKAKEEDEKKLLNNVIDRLDTIIAKLEDKSKK